MVLPSPPFIHTCILPFLYFLLCVNDLRRSSVISLFVTGYLNFTFFLLQQKCIFFYLYMLYMRCRLVSLFVLYPIFIYSFDHMQLPNEYLICLLSLSFYYKKMAWLYVFLMKITLFPHLPIKCTLGSILQ